MKKITMNFVMLLLALVGFMSSCSQNEEVTPQTAGGRNENGGLKTTSAITYQVKRYIFQRPSGANGLGHVGVGFEVRTFNGGTTPTNITYYYGAVENSSAAFTVPRNGYNAGWWTTTSSGASMLGIMRNSYGYTNYKYTGFVPLTATGRTNGINKIMDFPARGYALATNNCMNATYDVLIALNVSGATVAWPSTNYFPNGWYNNTTNGWSASTAL